jgi:DNA-binding NtrC family response regulator
MEGNTMNASILVVDDEPSVQDALGWLLRAEGYQVATVGSGEEALARIEQQEFDVIVSDIRMPGMNGLEVLERSRALNPGAGVILITAYATVDTAIEALRRGAGDYLEKPFGLDELKLSVQRLLRQRQAIREGARLQRAMRAHSGDHPLVGDSAAIRSVREHVARSAATPSNVLITGESGVGKELVAGAIHAASARRNGPFVAVNCGAIPENLLESQLFGHVRGAFTTAIQANPGLFMVAGHGTLFLDEIGEMPFPLQVKLLRVIEDRQVWPVGATKPVPVDVRIVASTNRDLPHEIEAGRFRADLFYRLDVVRIEVPPLRERREDIPVLVEHLVQRLNAKLGTSFSGVDREAAAILAAQPWKGNVRELENVLERAMVLGDGPVIVPRHLPASLPVAVSPEPPRQLRAAVRDFERRRILDVLAQVDSDKRRAARALGISLASLYRKLG